MLAGANFSCSFIAYIISPELKSISKEALALISISPYTPMEVKDRTIIKIMDTNLFFQHNTSNTIFTFIVSNNIINMLNKTFNFEFLLKLIFG